MSFIFRDWNAFVLHSLEISKNQLSLNETQVKEIIDRSVEMKEKVENGVIEYMLGKAKSREKKQYIKLLEIMVVNLLDRSYSNNQESFDCPDNSIVKSLSEHLKAFLNFLKENFTGYFDERQKVPTVIFEKNAKEIWTLGESIGNAVKVTSTHSRYIVELIAKSFKELYSKSIAPTYFDINYHLKLGRELLKEGVLSSESEIKKTLFYFNYNHTGLSKIIGKELSELVRKKKTKTGKILTLVMVQKKVNQYPVKLNYRLSPELPSLKELVNGWIEEEIKFLERDETLREEVNGDVYVHVPFRGTEIYLLHKAFVDSGGAAGETYKSLFEKTASHLINNNQKGFSTESLQKNGDKVNYEAKENVKRFLQRMIRNIDSY